MFHSTARRVAATLLLAGYVPATTGCTSWKTQQQGAEEVLAARPELQRADTTVQIGISGQRDTAVTVRSIRVTTATGRIEFHSPRIAKDSLFGHVSDNASEVGIPLATITSVEMRQPSTGKTVALSVGLAAGALLIIGTVAAANSLNDIGFSGGGDAGSYTSCPLIYSWDGHDWRLDSGTYGGAIMPALERTDVDNLLYAAAQGGIVRLRLADEQRETEYVNAVELLAVDHAASITVAPDASGNGTLHTLLAPEPPVAARNTDGDDVRAVLLEADGQFWTSALRTRDASDPAAWRDGVELTFARPQGANQAKLVIVARNTSWSAWLMSLMVRGWGRDALNWYDPATSAAYARALAPTLMDDGFLTALVWRDGPWQRAGFVWEAGPEVAKRQVLRLDLTGVAGDSVRVRLEASPTLWMLDQVAIDYSIDQPVMIRSAALTSASRPDGTDVGAQLRAIDQSYLTLETGQHVDLTFAVPPVAPGLTRSFLARTTGWYRVHGAETANPDTTLLAELRQPHGASRTVIRYSNRALEALR